MNHNVLIIAALSFAALNARAADCSVSTTGIAFGARPAAVSKTWDSVGHLTVTCSGRLGDQARYRVDLIRGGELDAVAGSSSFPFSMYLDPSRLRRWGDGTGGTQSLRDTMMLTTPITSRTYPIYARAFPARATRIGSYQAAPLVVLAEE